MQYLGGKSKIARHLAAAITPVRRNPDGSMRVVWDAFCGGLSMSAEFAKHGPVITSDANPALIALYQAVAAGWDPPEHVTEEQYHAGKSLPDTDPMKAFLGFGCAFGGKWFGGFARAKDKTDPRSIRGYAQAARNSVLRDVGAIMASGGVIACCSFLEVDPEPEDAEGLVIYCDPPYAGTTGYGATGSFDHERFWHRVRQWSELTDVFVSEYGAPHGRPVLEFSHDMSVAGGVQKDARTERLFHFSPDRPLEWSRRCA